MKLRRVKCGAHFEVQMDHQAFTTRRTCHTSGSKFDCKNTITIRCTMSGLKSNKK